MGDKYAEYIGRNLIDRVEMKIGDEVHIFNGEGKRIVIRPRKDEEASGCVVQPYNGKAEKIGFI